MVAIGASFNQGQFEAENRTFTPAEPSSFDGVMAKLKLHYFLIDLKGKTEDKEVIKWLNTENNIRGQDFGMTCIPAKSFDALYFIDHATKVIYNPTTREKLRN
jgi:hypothetical protein